MYSLFYTTGIITFCDLLLFLLDTMSWMSVHNEPKQIVKDRKTIFFGKYQMHRYMFNFHTTDEHWAIFIFSTSLIISCDRSFVLLGFGAFLCYLYVHLMTCTCPPYTPKSPSWPVPHEQESTSIRKYVKPSHQTSPHNFLKRSGSDKSSPQAHLKCQKASDISIN